MCSSRLAANFIIGEKTLPITTPEGYRAFDEKDLASYLQTLPDIKDRLGGDRESWTVSEVGDGNLNLVFIVEGPAGDICVKQALPYVRLVGDSWPLPLERAFFEQRATAIHRQFAADYVPDFLHYDERLFLIVMERFHPHIIMRQGMIDAVVYPRFAGHLADYCANSLFYTSDLAEAAADKKQKVAVFCANTELCKITEDLIFTDPYTIHERNRWTTPQLDQVAEEIRGDGALKAEVCTLKLKFLSRPEALLHGDLHTGSIMITQEETKVIDPEFAFYGPIGFDVGKLIGNLLLSYFSQQGHESEPGERDTYRNWILDTIESFWSGFERLFLKLWQNQASGDAFPDHLFAGTEGQAALANQQKAYIRRLFVDSTGYAGCSMIRRTLGLAHNIDMEHIEDPDRRARCEKLNLRLARELILNRSKIGSIGEITGRARAIYQTDQGH